MVAGQHGFPPLIAHLARLHHLPKARSLRILRPAPQRRPDRIPHEHRLREPQPVIATSRLPTRTKVWVDAKAEFHKDGKDFNVAVLDTFQASMAEDAFTPPLIWEWIEVSNVIWPKLQAAIVGDMSSKDALDAAPKAAATVMPDAGYN